MAAMPQNLFVLIIGDYARNYRTRAINLRAALQERLPESIGEDPRLDQTFEQATSIYHLQRIATELDRMRRALPLHRSLYLWIEGNLP